MITVIVVAPGLALRTGLRTLLDINPALQVAGDFPRLPPPHAAPSNVDVLVFAADTLDEAELQAWAEEASDLAVLLLTTESSLVQEISKHDFRAWGALPPDATPDEMSAALQALNEGLLVGSPALAAPILTRTLTINSPDVEPLLEPLTERETEVLQRLAQGLSNKGIAAVLYISEHTVKFHISSIYGKMGAGNRAEAVRLGMQQGLIAL